MINRKDDFAMSARTVTFAVLCAAFFFLTGRAFAEEVTLKAEVDKTSITTDISFTYKFTVIASLTRIPEPKLPDFSEFNVLSQANTSNITVERGKVRISMVYILVLAPARPGVFTINPAELQIGNKIYSSAEFKIKVDPGKLQPKASVPKQQDKKRHPQTPSFTNPQPQVTL